MEMNFNENSNMQSGGQVGAGVPLNPADFDGTHFKTEVGKLSDTIMKYASVYLRTRMYMRLFFKFQELYDNNRPGWRNDPRAKSLLQKLDSLEAQLQETKDIIVINKNLLMVIYEEVLTRHEQITKKCEQAGENDLEAKAVKAKIDEVKKDVNCKMLHVVAAMELIMHANLPQ